LTKFDGYFCDIISKLKSAKPEVKNRIKDGRRQQHENRVKHVKWARIAPDFDEIRNKELNKHAELEQITLRLLFNLAAPVLEST
jgi:hypothetical protein